MRRGLNHQLRNSEDNCKASEVCLSRGCLTYTHTTHTHTQELCQSLSSCEETVQELSASNQELKSNRQHLLEAHHLVAKEKGSAQVACIILAGCLLPVLSKMDQLIAERKWLLRQLDRLAAVEEEMRMVEKVVQDSDTEEEEEEEDWELHPLLRFRRAVVVVLAVGRLSKIGSRAHTMLRVFGSTGKRLPLACPSYSSCKLLSGWLLDDKLTCFITDSTHHLLTLLEPSELTLVPGHSPRREQRREKSSDLLCAVERSCEMLLLHFGDHYHQHTGGVLDLLKGGGEDASSLCCQLGEGLAALLRGKLQGSPYVCYNKVGLFVGIFVPSTAPT